jgi:hypothetical protein
MSPPPIAGILIDHFIDFLQLANIAVISASSSTQAQAVIYVVQKCVAAWKKMAASDERLKPYIDSIYAVLRSANTVDIAVDHDVAENTVRCIFSVIEVAVIVFLGPRDGVRERSPSIWSVLIPANHWRLTEVVSCG